VQRSEWNGQDSAVRRAGPEKLGQEVVGDYASSEHWHIGDLRLYHGVSYTRQEAATPQPIFLFLCFAIYLLNILPLDTNNKCIKSYTSY